jgi:hypothetical protein
VYICQGALPGHNFDIMISVAISFILMTRSLKQLVTAADFNIYYNTNSKHVFKKLGFMWTSNFNIKNQVLGYFILHQAFPAKILQLLDMLL